jgi:hypothetical protein
LFAPWFLLHAAFEAEIAVGTRDGARHCIQRSRLDLNDQYPVEKRKRAAAATR